MLYLVWECEIMADSALKNIMLESAKEVFETMIFLPLEETAEQDEEIEQSKSLICSITFTGRRQGCFLAQCRMESAEQIAKGMLMMEPGESVKENEICDAFGEMVNMIIGGIKARLSDTVGELKISILSTITGQPLEPMLGKAVEIVDLATRVEDKILKFVMQYSDKSWEKGDSDAQDKGHYDEERN